MGLALSLRLSSIAFLNSALWVAGMLETDVVGWNVVCEGL